RPRQETPLLVRAAVDDVADLLGGDLGRIEQRVALGCRSVSGNALACRLRVAEKPPQVGQEALDPRGEFAITIDRVQARRSLGFENSLDASGLGPGLRPVCPRGPDPE